MNIKLKKINKLSGTITAKPSKSFAHRYLIASALSNNESTISNVDFSDDIIATLNCIHAYGKKHFREFEKHEVRFKASCNKNFDPVFDCKESGTTLRLFMPIAMQKYEKATFIGSSRLIERGIDVYENAFKYISFSKDKYSIKTNGLLDPGHYELPGNISSQYISGLLYTLPLLNGDSEIIITTKLESINYILMTLDVLKNYQIEIDTNIDISQNDTKSDKASKIYFKIKGKQTYVAKDFYVEGDYSNASFIDAFNYFGNDVTLLGLNEKSLQSDKVYKKYFSMLNDGAPEIDISNCIDLGPILITFAALKNGARFTGTKRFKIKESDRGNVIANELKKCKTSIEVLDDEIIVQKKELQSPEIPFDSHNDHRIAMALSLLSTMFDIEINNAECVSKSYPGYFDDLKTLGVLIN